MFEEGLCGICKDPIREMRRQLEQVLERLLVTEKILAAGYIYPKTLPADAVIVIRDEAEISHAAASSIRAAVEGVWPGNKCVVLDDGMSMEIVEGGKQ